MRRASAEPWLIAAAIAAAYLLVQPPSADLAAQIYRTELFQREGFTLWNAQWFSGHHTPGYSVLFPPLAALLGPRVVGALAAVVAAVLFERLTRERFGSRARIGAVWFGAATATNLFSGRLTFALGVTVGLAALLALQHRRTWLAAGLAALCPLASPVAGLFLALAGLAYATAERRRSGLAVGGAAFGMSVVMSVAFPEGGTEPFVISAFWPILAFAAAVLVFVPAEERTLRYGAVLYAAACVAAFALDTPMGGNAARLGTMFGGPLLACVLWRRRPLALALAVVPLLYWQWSAPLRDVAIASGDPAVEASYYAPLRAFLMRQPGPAGTVEIPLTRNHWENVHVARDFPLARGWERQLDVKYNRLFYEPTLDPERYRAWLYRAGVEYVALPDARLDYSAIPEARLIRRGTPYLRPVWRSEHWRVYRVAGGSPVSGPAKLVARGNDSFTLVARRAGPVLVHMRYTPYWAIASGEGCIEEAPGGFTRLRLRRAGTVRVVTSFAPKRMLGRGSGCDPGRR